MTCDICKLNQAKYDCKTKQGPWANLCETCFKIYGTGLGLGKGQKIKENNK